MKQEMMDKNPILNRTFEFALAIIEYCKLLDEQKQYQLSKQLFRSGASIGANAKEAQNAESKADFIHKFKIAVKKQTKHNTGYYFVRFQMIFLIAVCCSNN